MTPFDGMKLWFDFARMGLEAQSVIAMRLAGMAGLWSVTPSENMRMITEKQQAMLESASAATQAMLKGRPPEAVAKVALRPVSRRTGANARRLAKRGPAIPKGK